MGSLRKVYDRILEVIAVILIIGVTAIVVLGVGYRWAGLSLVWYDEVAAISLAWLTYYASALAASRGAHIGFSGFVNALPTNLRIAATWFSSGVTIAFFALLAVTGVQVMQVLAGITLVSLPEVSQQLVASVIPIASVMFMVAELLRLPEILQEARRGPLIDHEVKEALETVQATDEMQQNGGRAP
jgi:TRAP-type C4-dicarboxylate transport system permease small subunit